MRLGFLFAGFVAALLVLGGALVFAATAVPQFETVDYAPPVRLADQGPAPELTGLGTWINSPPQTLASLKGKVVLIDFWTYGCANCIRTLPHVKRWQAEYADDGLVVIGAHTPEFPFERDPGGLRKAVARYGIRHAVVQDNDYATWQAYRNQYWPAIYLIDRRGHIVLEHAGEGDYAAIDQAIRETLAKPAPSTSGGSPARPSRPPSS